MATYELIQEGDFLEYKYDDVEKLIEEVYPVPNIGEFTMDFLTGQLSSKAQEELCQLIVAQVAKDMVGYISLAMEIVEIIEVIQDGIRWNDLKGYLKKMEKDDVLFIKSDMYIWHSGSGNSHAYTSKWAYKLN